MRHHLRSTACALLLLTVVCLVGGPASGAVVGARFHPTDYFALGTLNLSSGSVTFNTDTLQVTGAFTGTGVAGTTQGGTSVAVFDFDSISLTGATTVTVVGSRPLALLSRGGIDLGITLDVSGAAGQANTSQAAGRAGGFAGGVAQTQTTAALNGPGRAVLAGVLTQYEAGSGGGFGGAGGKGGIFFSPSSSPGAGGTTYGTTAVLDLLGGSGAAGSAANTGGSNIQNSGGGAGGGAIELYALGNITIQSTGSILANGGTGADGNTGGGGGSGGSVLLVAGGNIQNQGLLAANGGAGAGVAVGGGGGGGGRVSVQAAGFSNTPGTIQVTGGSGDPGSGTTSVGAAGGAGTSSLLTNKYNRLMISGPGTAVQDLNPHNYDNGLPTASWNQYMWFDFSGTLAGLRAGVPAFSAKLTWSGGTAVAYIPDGGAGSAVQTDLGVFAVPDANKGITTIFTALSGNENVNFYAANLANLVDSVTIPDPGASNQPVSVEWDVTSLVNEWIADPADPLRGQLVVINSAHPMWINWNGRLPSLTIELIPEPSAVMMLVGLGIAGLGGLVCRRCRR